MWIFDREPGINYHAFYRYARRIRAETAYVQTLGATLASEADLPRLLPRALAQRLLEALAFENPSPRAIHRMTERYRASVSALANVSRYTSSTRATRARRRKTIGSSTT